MTIRAIAPTTQRFTKKAPASALGLNLLPTIAVDTGARVTGICVRIGARDAAHTVVINPEHSGQAHTPGMDPANGYAKAVIDTLDEMAEACRATAVAWWATQDITIGPDEDPWLYAAEKVNNPRLAKNDVEAETFDGTEFAGGSIATARGVFAAVEAHVGYGRLVWTRPWEADTRWQVNREHGTGDPFDFYPESILAGVRRLPAGSVYRAACVDVATPHGGRVKDLCAAFSVSVDAALQYEAQCKRDRATGGKVVPPSRALHVVAKSSPAAIGGTVAPSVPVIVYAEDLVPANKVQAIELATRPAPAVVYQLPTVGYEDNWSLDGVDPFYSPTH